MYRCELSRRRLRQRFTSCAIGKRSHGTALRKARQDSQASLGCLSCFRLRCALFTFKRVIVDYKIIFIVIKHVNRAIRPGGSIFPFPETPDVPTVSTAAIFSGSGTRLCSPLNSKLRPNSPVNMSGLRSHIKLYCYLTGYFQHSIHSPGNQYKTKALKRLLVIN